jgi:hypothetical protein
MSNHPIESFIVTPGHGYLKVRSDFVAAIEETFNVEIVDEFCPVRGDFTFLEEDCALTRFADAVGPLNWDAIPEVHKGRI